MSGCCRLTFVLHLNNERADHNPVFQRQIVLPKAVRDLHRWSAGTRLTVETTKDGVVLKPEPLFAPKTLDDVIGCLGYKGPPKTIEEMDEAVLEEALLQNPRPRSDLDRD